MHWYEYIEELKKKVCDDKNMVLSGSAALIYDGKRLDDDATWWETGVFDCDAAPVLQLVER